MKKDQKKLKDEVDKKIKIVSKHIAKKHQEDKRKELESTIHQYGDDSYEDKESEIIKEEDQPVEELAFQKKYVFLLIKI